MMRPVAAALLALALGGCGTLENLSHDPKPYGGVDRCVTRCRECATDWHTDHGLRLAADYEIWTGTFVLDLPLSVIGDTVTLPWALFVDTLGRMDQPTTWRTEPAVGAGHDGPG